MNISRKISIISSLVVLLAAGCGKSTVSKSADSSKQIAVSNKQTASSTNLQAANGLTEYQLKNAAYGDTGFTGKPFTLNNGLYNLPPLNRESQADYYIKYDSAAFGDINGDGLNDAVAVLDSREGGTGDFVSLEIFLDKNGQPAYAASQYLGDRTKINSLAVENESIVISSAPWNGGYGQAQTVVYKLVDSHLVANQPATTPQVQNQPPATSSPSTTMPVGYTQTIQNAGKPDYRPGYIIVTQTVDGSADNTPYSQVQSGTNAFDLLNSTHKVSAENYGSGMGEFVQSIDGVTPDSKHFWAFYVNGQSSNLGASSYILKDGDVIEWKPEQIDSSKE